VSSACPRREREVERDRGGTVVKVLEEEGKANGDTHPKQATGSKQAAQS